MGCFFAALTLRELVWRLLAGGFEGWILGFDPVVFSQQASLLATREKARSRKSGRGLSHLARSPRERQSQTLSPLFCHSISFSDRPLARNSQAAPTSATHIVSNHKTKGGGSATYATFFCVHSRSARTSRASSSPCANRARVFARRACALAWSSSSSRCLALRWPDLLIVR